MGAPSYVPTPTLRNTARAYQGPWRRLGSWHADRPGEVVDRGQPAGERLGSQGPDQGFALRLARAFTPRLRLAPGEHVDDIIAGCVAVALKRAALHGRAPLTADLEVAFGIFGFFEERPAVALVERRRGLFDGVAHHHRYADARRLVDLVPEAVLRIAPGDATPAHLPA